MVGEFHAQDAVQICDEQGIEVGRGLVNYTSHEVDMIKVGRLAGWRGHGKLGSGGRCKRTLLWLAAGRGGEAHLAVAPGVTDGCRCSNRPPPTKRWQVGEAGKFEDRPGCKWCVLQV